MKNLNAFISFLYQLARFLNTAKAVSKGPGPTARRVKNIVIGRGIGRTGIWR